MFEPYLLRFTFNNCYYEKIGNNNPIKLDDLPFDIPDNWIWIRQKNICWLDNGVKAKGEKLPYLEAKVIRGKQSPSMVESGVIVDSNNKVILVDGENSGEIMTPPYKGYMGSTFKIFSATPLFNYSYLIEIFKLNKEKYKNSKVGAAIPHLNKELFKESLIAVPPFDEQQRIVKKINFFEQLIKEYDHNEKQLTELESSFADKLKKSILQYAIEGKLVKQDPNDEPASVLLERIKNEKEQLIKEGKIKRDKNESYIFQGDDKNYYEKVGKLAGKIDIPFVIPATWSWIKSKMILRNIQYGFNGAGLPSGTVKMLRITDIQNNKVDWNTLPYCAISNEAINDYQIEKDDLFIARTGGTIGKSFRLQEDRKNVVFAGYLIRFQLVDLSQGPYIEKYLNSPLYWSQVENKAAGTGQPNINGVSLSNLLIPIPPYKEQIRIINKINSIFSRID